MGVPGGQAGLARWWGTEQKGLQASILQGKRVPKLRTEDGARHFPAELHHHLSAPEPPPPPFTSRRFFPRQRLPTGPCLLASPGCVFSPAPPLARAPGGWALGTTATRMAPQGL